jgi:hypothetical protein
MLYLSTYHTDIFLVGQQDQTRALQLLKRRNDSETKSHENTSEVTSTNPVHSPVSKTVQHSGAQQSHSQGGSKSKLQAMDVPTRKGLLVNSLLDLCIN